jgi:hypothetical protein
MIAPTLMEGILITLQATVVLLGSFVAVQAYRAYRRYGERQLLYIGGGIALLTTIAEVISFGLSLGGAVPDTYIVFVRAIVYLLGLGSIDYALNFLD